jgi:protein involved in temperature-dependent protein secretion
MTQWLESEPGVYLGLGQRILATDVEEYPLMNIRHVTLGGEVEADTDIPKDTAEQSDG